MNKIEKNGSLHWVMPSEIKDLQDKVEFLLKNSGFVTGYLEKSDETFKHLYSEYFGEIDEKDKN